MNYINKNFVLSSIIKNILEIFEISEIFIFRIKK